MSNQILFPSQVVAYRMGNDAKITIIAKGYADGYCNIHIEPSMAQIYPPIFMVVGEPCAVIGEFPYNVKKTVAYSTDLDYVNFQMAHGTVQIPIHDVMAQDSTNLEATAPVPPSIQKVQNDQVIGYAYNSSDINKAISDAVTKLYQKFPGQAINAELVESGFVAAGSPVGIAYYYAIMEQKS